MNNEQREMAYHNLLCYSRNYLMTEPKPGFEKEWSKAKEIVNQIEGVK